MLLIAATAVWTAYYSGRKSIERDMVAIEGMHALAPELHIRNQNEYACLQVDRADDLREYKCYLPHGHQYNLHLQWSKEFELHEKQLQPDASVTISPGTHYVLMNELPDKLTVSVDDIEVMNVPRKRMASQGYASTGARDRFELQWHPLDRPLTLLRMRPNVNGVGFNGKGPGIALWIEMKD